MIKLSDLHKGIVLILKKHRGDVILFIFVIVLLIAGAKKISATYGNTPKRYPILPACTRFEYQIFKNIDFDDYDDKTKIKKLSDVDEWIKQYHSTVGAVIDENFNKEPPQCVGGSYAQATPPKANLMALARSLPSWNEYTWFYPMKDTDDDGKPGPVEPDDPLRDVIPMNDNLYKLSQLDMGTVLMEYLQMYECALIERSLFLPSETWDQENRRVSRLGSLPNPIKKIMTISSTITNAIADRKNIFDELLLARRSLNRALYLTTGYNRMIPMETEITCLQQASMDIRNGFALAADASSCLPRVWNIKTSLRNYKKEKKDKKIK